MSKQSSERQEVIADIQYLESLIVLEEREIKAQLIRQISKATNIEDKIDVFGGEVAYTLGKMSARIKLLEKALFNDQAAATDPIPVVNNAVNAVTNTAAEESQEFVDSLSWSADQFPLNNNFYHLENSNGILCKWTGPAPSTDILLPVNRKKYQELKVGIVAAIKPEILKMLGIYVDGVKVKYRLSYIDGVNYVNFILPKIAKDFGNTRLTIELPATYSPNALNGSTDTRQLGVALSEIALCGSPGLYKRFVNRIF